MLERRQLTTLDGARKAQIVASEELIFLSGMQPDTTDGDIKEQMRGALKNVDAALAEMGEDQASIFVIHIWLKDMRYFSAMNAVWNEWADAENPPSRTCVSGELYRPDLLVELVVTACRSKGADA
ncbi:RidA family protein [Sedimentitalea sp. JM2-8]|uniref:RidA family protein n=1 Tax=Sedimentitalea xiamensis TaxID=3050037 RepID=A0ABT7FLA5_9RHOB|nr:RidA family protein [Sedimentitalea xiamensis]MDK3075838.1 RidA family protein [Sedimentitalea xiamensis]